MKILPMASNKFFIISDKGIVISVTDEQNKIAIQKHKTEDVIGYSNQTAIPLSGEWYNFEAHFAGEQENKIKDADVINIR